MILTFRALAATPPDWKPAHANRPSSPFRAAYSDTLDVLDREIRALGGTDAFLQVVASDRDLRLDGQLRADARVEHPGVILTLETKKRGTLVFSTDRYQAAAWRRERQAGWQANLRAIALGLEALRTVERYGIAETGQQYAGYRELGSGTALGPATVVETITVDEAARLLAEHAFDEPDAWQDVLARGPDAAYRIAAKRHHPDAGGDPDVFRRLTLARNLLANVGGRA